MPLIPFIFDSSPAAKLIKSIDARERRLEPLEKLHDLMTHNIHLLPYGYLNQARRRAGSVLPHTRSQPERELLSAIQRMALHRMQRIHIESRP